ncbi:hypothetical protein [Streptomyces sp. NPDC047108]|uniref:hypothetical protein n=1 Tax=Streptomyces sp. NPDC047108 TaxID=3155025 RepID=UPI0033DDA219
MLLHSRLRRHRHPNPLTGLRLLTGVCRQLAAELGPQGVRVCWLPSPGSPAPGEENQADQAVLLAERPTYDDVANAAVFAASSWARR